MFKVLGSDSLLWSTLNWSSALPGGTLGDYLKASGRMRGEVCGKRSDLCRLGVGHYEMVTGKPP